MNEVERLQEYMLLIRRAVGWSAEEFGERIGVSRQTINNLEGKRNKLTKAQYIAIRSSLDVEIRQHPEDTDMLRLILDVFVDHPEIYDSNEREELLTKANMITPSILAGTTSRKEVSKELTSAAVAMGLITGAMIGTIGFAMIDGVIEWLVKAVTDKRK